MGSDVRSLDALVSAFRAGTLPKAAWTHAAHLRVGVWHVLTYGDAALDANQCGNFLFGNRHVLGSQRAKLCMTVLMCGLT